MIDKEIREQLFDPRQADKRCEPGICKALEAKGIDCDTVDVPALIDSTLSCDENKKNVLKEVGARKTEKYSRYAQQARHHYAGRGKLIHASPDERAAAFAQMRQDGTLRGYDPHKGSWLDFVKAHKNMRTSTGRLDLKAISRLWHGTGKVRVNDPAPKKARGYTGKPTRWFAAMVKGIDSRSDVRNPQAIVKAIWNRLTPRKKAQIKKQEKSGHVFKYDLPLPTDMATRGTGTVRTVKPFNLSEVQANVSGKDFEALKKSGLYERMRRNDGSIALVKRCKSGHGNCNIFIDKVR